MTTEFTKKEILDSLDGTLRIYAAECQEAKLHKDEDYLSTYSIVQLIRQGRIAMKKAFKNLGEWVTRPIEEEPPRDASYHAPDDPKG